MANRTASTRSEHYAAIGLLSLSLTGFLASSAAAKMGDCGQPTNNTSGDTPVASDALNVLNVAVGNLACHAAVCDVNNSGGTSPVKTSDALLVLKKAVGQTVTLTCPTCASTVCTACTETAIKARIDALNATGAGTTTDPNPQLLTSETSTIFRCGGPVDLADSTWGDKVITRSGVIFAADDRGLKLQLNPRCHKRCLGTCSNNSAKDCTQNSECGSGNTCVGYASITACTANSDCTTGSRCSESVCPKISSNARRFLRLDGDDITVRGFEVDGFFEGVRMNGKRGVVEKMTLTRMCDDAVGNDNLGVGGVVKGSTIQQGCDKCSEHASGPTISGSCTYPECNHMNYEDDTFSGCKFAVRASNQSTRVLVSGGSFAPQGSAWPCDIGVFPGASGIVTTVDDATVSTCKSGLWFGNGSHTVTQSTIDDNDQRGIMVTNGGASVKLRDSTIRDNGGVQSSDETGGVVIQLGGANLGTNSDPGHNCIHGNRKVTQGNDVGMEVNNQTTTNVDAQYNYWGGTSNPPVDEPVNTDNIWSGPCQ